MRRRYPILLLVAGTGWFGVAGVCGYAIPVFGNMWFWHLLCAVLTSLSVGITFRSAILRWQDWRWYALPLLTLLTGTAVFGFLVTCVWALADSLDSEAFYKLPLAIVFYSMSAFLPVLYPLALLTQHLLRRQMKAVHAEQGVSPNYGPPTPSGSSEVDGGPPSVR
jgi:hypothetical protein